MAQAHFNWLQLVPGVTHDNLHVATAAAVGTTIVVGAVAGRLALGSGAKAISPAPTFGLKGIFEMLTEFIVSLADMVIGEDHGRKFVPMFAAVFLFVWINNLTGLIPGMTPATDNLNTTFALGLFIFATYNFYGIKEHGISYIKQFAGPVKVMIPLMFMIELTSHLVRPLTLGLRLYGNILADHTVVGVFVSMFENIWFLPVPAIFYGMGIFVSTMQAFVLTLLSMIYVSLAISHDH